MAKREGKTYTTVAGLLRVRGVDPNGLEIATLGRGTDHLVLLNGETVGEYNHASKRLFLYEEQENAPE
jgi:hypothetical protein